MTQLQIAGNVTDQGKTYEIILKFGLSLTDPCKTNL